MKTRHVDLYLRNYLVTAYQLEVTNPDHFDIYVFVSKEVGILVQSLGSPISLACAYPYLMSHLRQNLVKIVS